MALFRVRCTGALLAEYVIEALDEGDAKDRWYEGRQVRSTERMWPESASLIVTSTKGS